MARILGLDLGSHSVKALVIESTFRGYDLKRYAEARVGDLDLKAALGRLAAEKHLAADQVVVSLPGTAAATHFITLPFTDARKVEQTLGFEVEGVVPFDLADVVYDYQVVGEHDGKTDILVGVVRKKDVSALLGMLAEVKVDPRVVTFAPLAYQNLLTLPQDAAEAEAVIDIGHERTCVYVAGPSGSEFARAFAGGGQDLTRLVAADLRLALGEAEAAKERGGILAAPSPDAGAERISNALVRGMAPIARELRATLRAHASRFRRSVVRAHLTGGSAQLRGLPELLSRDLGLTVGRLAAFPAGALAEFGQAPVPVAAHAFALALRGHAANRAARFNLRRGDFAFKGDFEYLKGKVGRLAAAAAALLLLAGASSWARMHNLSQREQGIDQGLCQTTQRVLGKCIKDFQVATSMLKGQGSPAAAIPQISALDLFAEFTGRTPADVQVKYEEIEVNLARIRVRGEAASFDAVDKIVAALKAYHCFTDIKRGRTQKTRDGSAIAFDLDIAVSCPEVGGGQG